MVHWIFVMKYFGTAMMLPKIFHEIMIDDFIEGGKFYNLDKTTIHQSESVQEKSMSHTGNNSED